MISIILPVRAQNNPECFIQRLIYCIYQTTTWEEREKLEILLKFDSCDQRRAEIFSFLGDIQLAASEIITTLVHTNYMAIRIPDPEGLGSGVVMKIFTYNRGEGRSDIDRTLAYLGTCVEPNSKLIFNIACDYIFTRNGWVTELLDEYDKSENKYIIFHSCAVIDENIKYTATGEIRTDTPREFSKKRLFDYEEVTACTKTFRESTMEYYNSSYAPICSTKLFHTISGQCFQPSIDLHFILLAASLVCVYETNIWNDNIEPFYTRGMSEEGSYFSNEQRDAVHGGNGYNLNELSGKIQQVRNPLYFELVKQQAKNIFLNMKSDKSSEKSNGETK